MPLAKALQACGKLSSNSANPQPHRTQKVAFIYIYIHSFLPSIKCKLQIIMVILMIMIHTGHPQWSSIQSVIHLWPHLRWLCLLTITSPISTPLGALTAASWLGNQDSNVFQCDLVLKVSGLGEMLKLTKMNYDESNEGAGFFPTIHGIFGWCFASKFCMKVQIICHKSKSIYWSQYMIRLTNAQVWLTCKYIWHIMHIAHICAFYG